MHKREDYDGAERILHEGRVAVLKILGDVSRGVSAQLDDALHVIQETHQIEKRYWAKLDKAKPTFKLAGRA